LIHQPNYDETEFNNLHERLLNQRINAFFCVVANTPLLQSQIARDMSEHFEPGKVQIIDFFNMENSFVFSSLSLISYLKEDTKILFLVNFQLAGGDLSDEKFLQALNLSRDALAELSCVLVFMMPMYFRTMIARKAPDFNSFFQHRSDFIALDSDKSITPEMEKLPHGYSETKKELLGYYQDRYNDLKNHEAKQAFEVILKILELNKDVRVLHFAELNYFYNEFKKLLPIFQSEMEDFAFSIANVFEGRGDFVNALEWYFKCLAIEERVYGKEHLNTARTYSNIAGVFFAQSNCGRALEYFGYALTVREELLGKEHLDTAHTYDNMAIIFCEQNDYGKALEYHRRALAVREKFLGKEHPSTADTYNNMAIVFQTQGDYDKALEYHSYALAVREKLLGKEHPSTAITYNNMAIVFQTQGDYDKALEYHSYALAVREKLLGKEHPSTARTYHNMAMLFQTQGDYDKALGLFLKASKIWTATLKEKHPNTRSAYIRLKNLYCKLNPVSTEIDFEKWFKEQLNAWQ